METEKMTIEEITKELEAIPPQQYKDKEKRIEELRNEVFKRAAQNSKDNEKIIKEVKSTIEYMYLTFGLLFCTLAWCAYELLYSIHTRFLSSTSSKYAAIAEVIILATLFGYWIWKKVKANSSQKPEPKVRSYNKKAEGLSNENYTKGSDD